MEVSELQHLRPTSHLLKTRQMLKCSAETTPRGKKSGEEERIVSNTWGFGEKLFLYCAGGPNMYFFNHLKYVWEEGGFV